MIGTVTEITPSFITLENGGIGYLVYTPNPYAFESGTEYKVYLYQQIKEDEHALFGFKTLEEKGVVDEGKLTAQSFFQAVGMENAVKEMQGGLSDASTSKQLEKSSQGATKKKMEKVKEMSDNSKRLAEEIFLLTEKIKRK